MRSSVAGAVMVSSGAGGQSAVGAPADTAAYAVSYVEVTAASKTPAIAALRQYREACRKSDGYLHVELFEQVGRPGHFAVVETWRDPKALATHGPAQQQLLDALQPNRVSGYDERPYKKLTAGRLPAPSGRCSSFTRRRVADPRGRDAQTVGRGSRKRMAVSIRRDPAHDARIISPSSRHAEPEGLRRTSRQRTRNSIATNAAADGSLLDERVQPRIGPASALTSGAAVSESRPDHGSTLRHRALEKSKSPRRAAVSALNVVPTGPLLVSVDPCRPPERLP